MAPAAARLEGEGNGEGAVVVHAPAAEEDSRSLEVKGRELEGLPLPLLPGPLPSLDGGCEGGCGGFWKAARAGRRATPRWR